MAAAKKDSCCPHRHGSRRRRGYSPARHQEYQAVIIKQVGIAKGSVLDLVSQVRDAILMNVYLEVRNPGGSGFWSRGYMSKGREMGRAFTSKRRPRWTDPVTARRVPSK